MAALVISAFPGCGQSTYYKKYGMTQKILDSDSSNFSWIKDAEGNNTKERNPEFPLNYINHIKENIYNTDIIFVSSHEIVRKAMADNGIRYVNIYPKDTVQNMKEWRNRFIERNNSQSFINTVMENWSKWILSMVNDTSATRNIELDLFDGSAFITETLIKSIPRRR